MRYLAVCSGIEAATVAWHPLGWTPQAFSEIEPFPSAVLAHRYGSNLPGEPLTHGMFLMPVECERLQGFPDGYTDVPYRRKPAADGPRYKALGNSMAVNVMRWIGRRIEMVENLEKATTQQQGET